MEGEGKGREEVRREGGRKMEKRKGGKREEGGGQQWKLLQSSNKQRKNREGETWRRDGERETKEEKEGGVVRWERGETERW